MRGWRHVRNSARLLHIARVLARHDALSGLEHIGVNPGVLQLSRILGHRMSSLRLGQRLAAAFEELGPTFIKLGQALSTRADLVGEDVARDLAGLRDQLPPFPTLIARKIIESELDRPMNELFLSFDEVPIAAASMAQVHFAVLPSGEPVAVKVLRPNIDKAFARDLELFHWLAELAENNLPQYRRLKPREVVRTLEDSINMELDLRFEASSAVELADNMRENRHFKVPNIHWTYTAQKVLVMERIYGIPVHEVESIRAAGHDTDLILAHAANDFFEQVFRDGFFHADLHPGNLFITPDGRMAVVDFGIMGRLDMQSRIYIADIMRGFLNEDYDLVARTHFEAGYVPSHKSLDQFRVACMAVGKPILGKPLSEISVAKLLGQMFQVARTFEMETQPQLLMLQKTMMLAEGVGRMLNPNVNMWQVSEPLISRWAEENLSPPARLRLVAQAWKDRVQQAPELADRLAHLLRETDMHGFRLHSATLEALDERRAARHRQWLLFAWAALFTALALAF